MDTLLNDPAPGDKVIVLATDGEPDTCAEPNPQNGQGVAVAAAAAPGLAAAASAEVETPAQSQQEGYRLTQHVLDYYKSASA